MEQHEHEWEKLGTWGKRFMPWSNRRVTHIVYICKICLEQRKIEV